MHSRLRHTFRALRHRHFRTFWIGQWVSVTGTWMQTMALSWLVYRLTNSPLVLGLLSAARFGPSLLVSPLAGVVSDRFPRRNLVLLTQFLSLAQAAVLTFLTMSGMVQVWHAIALALFQGLVDTFDMPARQAMQMDIVGAEDLQSAVALNSAAFNAGRMVGPAIAGLLVAVFGEGVCFATNAASYLAVLIALAQIPPMAAAKRASASVGKEVMEGIRFTWSAPDIRAVILAVAVTSSAGLSSYTLLPIFARDFLHSGSAGYGALLGGAGVGAILGALSAAGRSSARSARLVTTVGQGTLGAGLIALAVTRRLPLSISWMVIVGFAMATQLSTTNAFIQTSAPAQLRGRVLSFYFWFFTGLSPLGSLAAGWIAEHVGAPWTAAGGGAVCLISAVIIGFLLLRSQQHRLPHSNEEHPTIP